MKNVVQWLRLIFEGSFISTLYSIGYHIKQLKQLKTVDFDNILNYYKSNKKQGIAEKNILIEYNLDEPFSVSLFMISYLFLSHKYVTNPVVIIKKWTLFEFKFLFRKYGVKKIVYLYSWNHLYYKMKAVATVIKNLQNLSYVENYGWHLFADGIDLGDLAYDEFLRFTNLPTYRHMDLKFLLFLINKMAIFYRYKSILKKYEITDMITSDIVYMSKGSVVRAAALLKKEIFVYYQTGQSKINLSVRKATTTLARRYQVYEEYYIEKIINKYGKQRLLVEYEEYMTKRMTGVSINFDAQFVYQNIEINNKNDFFTRFKKHRWGKNIFIFSHAFLDAVKCCETLYSDYYTWLYNTLVALVEKSHYHNIFVKPHPSEELYQCNITVRSVVDEINERYNGEIVYLDKKVHNDVVFKVCDAIITVCGTIALEAVPHGIPVLAAGKGSYNKANIVIQPQTIDDYLAYLTNIENTPAPAPETVEIAKLCFLLYEKYFFIKTFFFFFLDLSSVIKNNVDILSFYAELNSFYSINKLLEEDPLYKMFCYMIDNDYNDTIDLTDG
jgi:hypothetical protein